MPEGFLPPVVAELKGHLDGSFESMIGSAKGQMGELEKSGGGNFNRLAAVGQAAFLGIGAAAVGVAVVSIRAADQWEAAHARLETAVKNSGASWTSWSGDVDKADHTLEGLGFTNADTENALARLIPVTHTHAQALKDEALAADISRARHLDLEAATQLVIKVETGHVSLLGRLGIQTKDAAGATISQTQALAELTKLYGGSASAYTHTFSGEMKVLSATVTDTAKNIGVFLIPYVQGAASAFADGTHWILEHKVAAIGLAAVIGGPLVVSMATFLALKVASGVAAMVTAFGDLTVGASVVAGTIMEIAPAALLGAGALGLLAGGVLYGMKTLGLFDDVAKPLILDLSKLGSATVPQLVQSLDKLTESAHRGYAAGQEATGAYEHMDSAQNQASISARNTSLLHQQFNDVLAKTPQYADKFIDAIQTAGQNTSWYTNQLDAHVRKQAEAQRQTELYKSKLDGLTQGYTADTAALLANEDAINKSIDPTLNAQKAILQTNQAVRDMVGAAYAAAAAHGTDAAANDQYSLSLIGAKQSVEDMVTAQLKAGSSNAQVVASLQGVENQLAPNNPLRQFIDQYISRLNAASGDHHATITADTSQGEASLRRFIGLLTTAQQAGAAPGIGIATPKGTPHYSPFGVYLGTYAKGGDASGWGIAGEAGPELINFGTGAHVYSNAESQEILGGGGPVAVLQPVIVGTLSAAQSKSLAKQLGDDLNEVLLKMNREGRGGYAS